MSIARKRLASEPAKLGGNDPTSSKSLQLSSRGQKPDCRRRDGARDDVIKRILEVVPTANFSNPAWGLIDGGSWSVEVNLGLDTLCNGFALHVRGGDEAVGVVAAILAHMRLRAIDSQTADFFEAGPAALQSFQKWREYRARTVDEGA